MADPPRSPHPKPHVTPRWVKVGGIVAAIVLVVLVVLALAGVEHGPGRHVPGGDDDRHTPPVQHSR